MNVEERNKICCVCICGSSPCFVPFSFHYIVLKQGTDSIKGLRLGLPTWMEDMKGWKTTPASYAKRLDNENSNDKLMLAHSGSFSKRGHLGLFSWQPAIRASANLFSSKAFAKMQKLKILHLNDVELSGGYEDFPRSLVWLYWRVFPLNSIPVDMCLEKLVVLDMRNSNLKHVWKGVGV